MSFQPDNCRNCRCDEGTVTCQERTCPDLGCANTMKVPGQCCEVCSGADPFFVERINLPANVERDKVLPVITDIIHLVPEPAGNGVHWSTSGLTTYCTLSSLSSVAFLQSNHSVSHVI
ncbi:extracellular matrix protein 2-like [Argopecten irradians]|uniref:extracellular matrix protein 2-like n=1 Tax=Argopecten irradians TaxID=31199 RepID=UPI0037242864